MPDVAPVEGATAAAPPEEMFSLAKAEALFAARIAESQAAADKRHAESTKEIKKLAGQLAALELDPEEREKVYGAEPVRRDAAAHLSSQFGVPPELLEGVWPYEDMKAKAQQWQETVKAGVAEGLKKLAAQGPAASTAAQERSLSGNLPIPTAGMGDDAAYIKGAADGTIPWDAARSAAIQKRMGLA